MPNTHILSSFDDDLNNLRIKIIDMANLVEEQYEDAHKALIKKDLKLAKRICETDNQVDLMERDIEKKAIDMIALRSPMADDLREIISAIKISNALERIGDYAKNLAKRMTILSNEKEITATTSLITQMITIINRMNSDVIDAYITRDSARALEVWNKDIDVDNLYNSLFRELLTYMMENPHYITAATHLLFIAKNIERAGDHLTNIAEYVYYIVEGEPLDIPRPKGTGA